MKSVIIDRKKILAEGGTPLKELLSAEGYLFPCQGTGKCGKCRIKCALLAPTQLDRRFLSESQLNDGIRLACDKVIETDIIAEALMQKGTAQKEYRKLSECSVVVGLGIETIDISLLDSEGIVETVTIENPLSAIGGMSEISAQYQQDGGRISRILRSAIGKECVELFERYGVAKAEYIAISASEFYIKLLTVSALDGSGEDYERAAKNDSLSLPTESVFFLPYINDYIGADLLCETVNIKEPALIVDCESTAVIISITAKDNVATAMWDMDFLSEDGIAERALRAGILFMTEGAEKKPIVYLYGRYLEIAESVLSSLDMPYIIKSKDARNIADACLNIRVKAKINKERARTSVVKLFNNELFQKYFNQ